MNRPSMAFSNEIRCISVETIQTFIGSFYEFFFWKYLISLINRILWTSLNLFPPRYQEFTMMWTSHQKLATKGCKVRHPTLFISNHGEQRMKSIQWMNGRRCKKRAKRKDEWNNLIPSIFKGNLLIMISIDFFLLLLLFIPYQVHFL